MKVSSFIMMSKYENVKYWHRNWVSPPLSSDKCLFIFCLKDPYSQSAYVWSRCVLKIRQELIGVLVSLKFSFIFYARGSEELNLEEKKGRCGFITYSPKWKWPRHEKQLHINLKFHFSLTSFKDLNFPWLRLKFSDFPQALK